MTSRSQTTGRTRMATLRRLLIVVLGLAWSLGGTAKDYRDTLFTDDNDRIIIEYTVSQAQGQTTVTFNSIQKKLSDRHLRSYQPDKVRVMFFDRTGTYGDTKIEGMVPTAFMVPSGTQYTPSTDGFFFVDEKPVLQFETSAETTFTIPLFLANREKKRHWKLFAQGANMRFTAKAMPGGGRNGAARGGRSQGGGGGGGTDVITSEELLDEGLTPSDDALLTIENVKEKLAKAERLPFSADLTYQADHLRALRSQISDPGIQEQINKVLDAFDQKELELQKQAEQKQADDIAKQKEDAKRQMEEQQARQDSIQAAQEKKADEKQKDMMWLIGGIAGLGMLLMGGKQIFQTIKNNKMQKMMMDNLNKATQQASAQVKIPGLDDNPLTKGINQQLQRDARKTLTKEGEAAKQKLAALRKGNTTSQASPSSQPSYTSQPSPSSQTSQTSQTSQASTPGKRPLRTASQVRAEAMGKPNTQDAGIEITTKPQKPSLNDVIPAKYKRWRKPGTPDSNK